MKRHRRTHIATIMLFSLPICSSVLIGFENKSSKCLAGGSSAIALLKYTFLIEQY
jgi:hypothetical protein